MAKQQGSGKFSPMDLQERWMVLKLPAHAALRQDLAV